jgi:hypothetical protein
MMYRRLPCGFLICLRFRLAAVVSSIVRLFLASCLLVDLLRLAAVLSLVGRPVVPDELAASTSPLVRPSTRLRSLPALTTAIPAVILGAASTAAPVCVLAGATSARKGFSGWLLKLLQEPRCLHRILPKQSAHPEPPRTSNPRAPQIREVPENLAGGRIPNPRAPRARARAPRPEQGAQIGQGDPACI